MCRKLHIVITEYLLCKENVGVNIKMVYKESTYYRIWKCPILRYNHVKFYVNLT